MRKQDKALGQKTFADLGRCTKIIWPPPKPKLGIQFKCKFIFGYDQKQFCKDDDSHDVMTTTTLLMIPPKTNPTSISAAFFPSTHWLAVKIHSSLNIKMMVLSLNDMIRHTRKCAKTPEKLCTWWELPHSRQKWCRSRPAQPFQICREIYISKSRQREIFQQLINLPRPPIDGDLLPSNNPGILLSKTTYAGLQRVCDKF